MDQIERKSAGVTLISRTHLRAKKGPLAPELDSAPGQTPTYGHANSQLSDTLNQREGATTGNRCPKSSNNSTPRSLSSDCPGSALCDLLQRRGSVLEMVRVRAGCSFPEMHQNHQIGIYRLFFVLLEDIIQPVEFDLVFEARIIDLAVCLAAFG